MLRLLLPIIGVVTIALILSALGAFWTEQRLTADKFVSNAGHCFVYTIDLLTPSDTMESSLSELLLFEDDNMLDPAHVQHEAIRQEGRGRFSHWGKDIYMSSSDNSDPRTNGRRYKIAYPLKAPFSIVLFSLFVSVLSLPFAASTAAGRKRIYKHYYVPVMVIVTSIVIAIIPIELFLRTDYSKQYGFGAFQQLPVKLQPTVNTKGYRDREHAIDTPPHHVRILVLGDSLTFGQGVADDEVYPRLLQCLTGPDVEIISLAKNGWGTADQLAALRRDGLAYSPDIVMVGVVTNDPSPPLTEDIGQSPPWNVFQRLSRNVMLFKLLDARINLFADSMGWKYSYRDWEHDIYDTGKRYRVQWEKAVIDLSQDLHSRGILAYAFILVGPTQTTESDAWKFKILDHVFSTAGFKTLNLLEPYTVKFRGVAPTSLYALPDDSHPGREVQQFFADEIWKTLRPAIEGLGKTSRLRPSDGHDSKDCRDTLYQ